MIYTLYFIRRKHLGGLTEKAMDSHVYQDQGGTAWSL